MENTMSTSMKWPLNASLVQRPSWKLSSTIICGLIGGCSKIMLGKYVVVNFISKSKSENVVIVELDHLDSPKLKLDRLK